MKYGGMFHVAREEEGIHFKLISISSQKKFKFAIDVFKHNFNHVHCSGVMMPIQLEMMKDIRKQFTENRLLRMNKRVTARSSHIKKSLRKKTAENFTIQKTK